jgi:hypothetical protein
MGVTHRERKNQRAPSLWVRGIDLARLISSTSERPPENNPPCRALAHGLETEHCSTVRTPVRGTVSTSVRPARLHNVAHPEPYGKFRTWLHCAIPSSSLLVALLRLSLPLAAPTTAVSSTNPHESLGSTTNYQPTLRRTHGGPSCSRLASSSRSAIPLSVFVVPPVLTDTYPSS